MDFLAFDLGASGGKMFRGAYDGEQLRLSPVYDFRNRMIQLGDSLYWDFLGIYQHMCTGIRKAAHEKPFHSFGVDSFNNDFSLISAQGDLLMPIRSYRDPRTERHRDAIYGQISPERLYSFTGNQIAPFNTFMQLAAMKEEGQGYLLDHAHRLLFLPDLIGYYLTGEQYTEYSVASETQMLDWHSRHWIPQLLDLLKLREDLFAPIIMPGTMVGPISQAFQRQHQVPSFSHVAVCEHDTASAFLSAPLKGNSAILSCGTWTIIGAENEQPVITSYGFEHNIANEGSLPGHHRISYNVMGLWLIQQLREDYALSGQPFEYEDIKAAALDAPAFQIVINPDDPAFYSPGGMAERIINGRLNPAGRADALEPGALFRCVYECLALQYRWALDKIETLLGRRFDTISLIGGGSQDEVLCQFTADATNRPVIAGPVQASSVGNMLVQMLAHGEIGDIHQGREIVRQSFRLQEYFPSDTALWQEQYQRFLALVHAQEAAKG